MKAKDDFLVVKDMYSKLNKKITIGYAVAFGGFLMLGAFVNELLPFVIGIFLFIGYLLLMFINANAKQIQESFAVYFAIFLQEMAKKYSIVFDKNPDVFMSKNKLVNLFGDKDDNEYMTGLEIHFIYEGKKTIISKIQVRGYENQLPKTIFNGYVVSFEVDNDKPNYLYLNGNDIESFSKKYMPYQEDAYDTNARLFVLDGNDYSSTQDQTEKIKNTFGEDVLIYKQDTQLLIATNKKLPMQSYNIITYRDFSEEAYEDMVKSYVDLHNTLEQINKA